MLMREMQCSRMHANLLHINWPILSCTYGIVSCYKAGIWRYSSHSVIALVCFKYTKRTKRVTRSLKYCL